MAVSNNVVWEVQATGTSDLNGGGFKAGATGTDYSTQTTAQKSGSDLVIHASTNTKAHPVAAGVAPQDVGNVIQIASGTGFTVGFYEITAQDGTDWTLDRAVGTVGSTGGVYKMGGALASIDKIGTAGTSVIKPGQKLFVKAGTYVRTATSTVNVGANNYFENSASRAFRVIGYNTTRGDTPTGNNRPVIQLSGSGLTCLDFSSGFNGACWLENMILDGNSQTTSSGLTLSGAAIWSTIVNVTAKNCTSVGIYSRGESMLIDCEATNITGGLGGIRILGDWALVRCWSHDNTVSGFYLANKSGVMYQCISSNNTGSSSHGAEMAYGYQIIQSVFYKNGGDGIRTISSGVLAYQFIMNNVITENGQSGTGYGVNFSANFFPRLPIFAFNAFYGNATGAHRDFADTTGSNGVGAMADPNITLTGDPFTAAASNDFTLNSTAGRGAACKSAGTLGTFIAGGLNTVGYLDVGAFQAAAGGGGLAMPVAGAKQ